MTEVVHRSPSEQISTLTATTDQLQAEIQRLQQMIGLLFFAIVGMAILIGVRHGKANHLE